jgi:hypothetical protein
LFVQELLLKTSRVQFSSVQFCSVLFCSVLFRSVFDVGRQRKSSGCEGVGGYNAVDEIWDCGCEADTLRLTGSAWTWAQIPCQWLNHIEEYILYVHLLAYQHTACVHCSPGCIRINSFIIKPSRGLWATRMPVGTLLLSRVEGIL